MTACTSVSSAEETRLFAQPEYSRDITPFYKWTDVIHRMDREKNPEDVFRVYASAAYGPPTLADIRKTNKTINQYRFIDDQKGLGKTDYWQSPGEFFRHGGGDCEDFAIAKYALLKSMGMPEKDMRLAIVRDDVQNKMHTLLLVDVNGKPMALDNQENETDSNFVMAHYEPVFGFNRDAWWLYPKKDKQEKDKL